jgi:hypothetical protein
VISAQLAAFIVYAFVVLPSDTAKPFSTEDWLFAFLPPAIFVPLLLLGLRIRPESPRWSRLASTAANVLTGVAVVFTLIVIPVWVYGNLTDMDV